MELEHPPASPTKRCPMCRHHKPMDDFPRNRATKDGRATYCKPCHNQRMKEISDRLYGGHANYLRRKRYGIDASELADKVIAQGGTCAICQTRAAVHVDHNHHTGQIRQILCFACNRGLGKVNDNPDVLRAMIDYLRKHASGE